MLRRLSAALAALMLVGSASAAPLVTEDFNYATGQLKVVGAPLWDDHGVSATNPQLVVGTSLTYPGLTTSFGSSTFTNNGEDVSLGGFSITGSGAGETAYYSAIVTFTSTGTGTTTGDYFMHFNDGTQLGTAFRGRVFARSVVVGSTFQIGLQYGSSATNLTYGSTVLPINTPFLIVLKLTSTPGTSNDTAAVFINPVLGGAEPTPEVSVVSSDVTSQDFTNLVAVAIRQGTAANAPAGAFDYIRVGTTWADVTSSNIVATPVQYTAAPASLSGGTTVDVAVDTVPVSVSTVINATTGTVTIDAVNITGSGLWTAAPGNPTSVAVGTTASLSFLYTPTVNDGATAAATASVVTSTNNPTSFTVTLSGRTVVDSSISAFKALLEAGTAGTATYKMTGFVNSNNLVSGGDGFAFQDLIDGSPATRGMSAFDLPNTFLSTGNMPAVGDEVLFYGTTASFRGLAEVVPTRAFSVLSSGATIVPAPINGTAMSDANESVLVIVDDAIVPVGTFGPAGVSVTVEDDSTSTFTMRLQTVAAITYNGLGIPLDMTGVVGQFDVTNPIAGGTGYQLQPRYVSEVPVEASSFVIE